MSWRERANCRDVAPDIFFPTTRGIPTEAAALCRSCEVRAECATFAEDNAVAGVWAGERLDAEPMSDGLDLRRRRSA